MSKEALVKQTRDALSRLGDECLHPDGFNEYAHFCEERLFEIIPYLSPKGLRLLRDEALSCCRLDG